MDYVGDLRKLVGHRPLILTGAVVLLVNGGNELLLQHRTDGSWGLPGGLMELGESLEDTARREVKEETGLHMGQLNLLDVFSGSDYFFQAANGDQFYSVTSVYVTHEFSGDLIVDRSESLDLQFFPVDLLPQGLAEEYKCYINAFTNEWQS